MNKELLTKLNYEKLVLKTIQECETTELTFNRWLRHYGLYCSGREFNAQAELEGINIRVETTELARALYNCKMKKNISKYEEGLVASAREEICADLVLKNVGPKLKLI